MYCYPSIICWVIAVLCSNPLHPSYTPVVGALLTLSSLSVISNSTLLCEIDKCIGYWLSLMPTSTSMHPFSGPLLCPLSASCLAGGGVSLAGLGAPSGDHWAVTGSSSASLSLQSGARWGLVREPSLPKWPPSNWEKKTSYRSRFTSFLLGELDNAANKLTNISYFVIEIPHVLT